MTRLHCIVYSELYIYNRTLIDTKYYITYEIFEAVGVARMTSSISCTVAKIAAGVFFPFIPLYILSNISLKKAPV